MKFQFAIDRGGTFTDIYCRCPSGKVVVMKLLSVDSSYPDAPREGIRRIIEKETGQKIGKDELIDASQIEWIRMGTTVATNALLERKGERMALIITKGFRDLLHIGNQARPKIFDLAIEMPEKIYEQVIEVEERILPSRSDCQLENLEKDSSSSWRNAKNLTGDSVLISKEINTEKLKKDLEKLRENGINSLAVVFLHSYMYSKHEEIVEKMALDLEFTHVSLSSKVIQMIRVVPRGFTTLVDSYLTPLIKNYLRGFSSGFKNLEDSSVLFMKSDGGLTPMDEFCGSRAILSGPAGGVNGYSRTCYDEYKIPVIGFDMGGTSTDVSRFAGQFEHTYESTTAGVTIQSPQLDISTVAAGGGSMLFFRNGLFVVGPESAGASPGPICYKKGGEILTITDANLCLGRIIPEYFPKIFGPNDDEELDKVATLEKFKIMSQEVNTFLKGHGSTEISNEEVIMGFIRIAIEAMCRPIRNITQGKGFDTSTHILATFGGAGGQFACSMARNLGISQVFIPRFAGILSAFGIALADVVYEKQEPFGKELKESYIGYIDSRIDKLVQESIKHLQNKNYKNIETEVYLHLRYDKTDCALMCLGEGISRNPGENGKSTGEKSKYGDFKSTFVERYQKEFGFLILDRAVIVDDIRVRAIGKTQIEVNQPSNSTSPENTGNINSPESGKSVKSSQVYFEEDGWTETPIYLLNELPGGTKIEGPAIIMDSTSTILIEPNCSAGITGKGDIKIKIGTVKRNKMTTEFNSIQLSIFSHRFMSIAEQMGRVLEKTSISTNIKERLDFSCAVFGGNGGLVSNAPHIPVHLGAMQEAVQFQIKALGKDLKPGDVILSNHPCAGGSHLPDLTVITPVFKENDGKNPIFFVASRGHHADIGGITPGSMPPHSRYLWEEGANFISFKLVSDGIFREAEVTEKLMAPGKLPGSSGTRNLQDNLSDLKAQIAANQKGINLIQGLISYYGLDVVVAYMNYIQQNAELAVRNMLKEFAVKLNRNNLNSEDYLDMGAKIQLLINIDPTTGNSVFDFTGTDVEVWGNLNAPKAITVSAIIYCLRCLVGQDIPLNQGCLAPIKMIIPEGSILNPSEDAAVVGGNVLTSQRVVDVILKAFEACAASQGCMNNLTFGDTQFGYYETISGGSGAGPTWHGRSGVHTHMTNTRITDPELLESRYPVILNQFCLEAGTGGKGKFHGGDGVRREIIFRKNLTVSILSERRVFFPYGLKGGEDGKKGKNLLTRFKGKTINLGGKTSVEAFAGDLLTILTPGGGGYGTQEKIVN